MRKLIIALIMIVVVGLGSYFGYQRFKGTLDSKLTELINTNMNKPIAIKNLTIVLLKEVNWTITAYANNIINSQISFKYVENENEIKIPITSTITKGTIQYKGEKYGYGKIVSKADLSQFKNDYLNLVADSFTSTQYITLTGDIAEVTKFAKFSLDSKDNSNGKLDFKGATMVRKFSLVNIDRFPFKNLVIDFLGLDVNDNSSSMSITPVNIKINIDENKIHGSSIPIKMAVTNLKSPAKSTTIDIGNIIFDGRLVKMDKVYKPFLTEKLKIDHIKFNDYLLSNKPVPIPWELSHLEFAVLHKEVGDYVDSSITISAMVNGRSIREQLSPVMKARIPFALKSFDIEFGFENNYYENFNVLPVGDGKEKLNKLQDILDKAQTKDLKIYFITNFKTDSGNANGQGELGLSSIGKSVDIRLFRDYSPYKIYEGITRLNVDKTLADKVNLSSQFPWFGKVIENNQLVFKAELKNGQVTFNGKPL